MYSVVLATVLTAGGTSAPAWLLHGGCYGGCTGPVVSGYSHGCRGACYGSCYGACYGSCYGSCYSSCHGAYAGPLYNGYLYNTGYYAAFRPVVVAYAGAFGGCYGSYTACFGGGTFVAPPPPPPGPRPPAPPTGREPIPPPGREQPKPPPAKEEAKARPTQATVIVKLPEDATLIVDGYMANLASDTRTFVTPDLDPDRDYYYTITAELIRDGRSLKETQQVFVRAGETARVNFRDLTATARR